MKMKLSKSGIAIIAIIVISAPILTYGFILRYDECMEAKADYEQDKQMAIEKHGYETFDEWRESDGRDFSPNCVLKIWKSAAPPVG